MSGWRLNDVGIIVVAANVKMRIQQREQPQLVARFRLRFKFGVHKHGRRVRIGDHFFNDPITSFAI